MPAVFGALTISISVPAAYYAAASAIAAVWNAFVVSKVLSVASRALSGRPKGIGPERPQARDLTITGSVEPGVIIMGYTRTSGALLFVGSSGDHNQYLHFVLAVAHHQCEDIDNYWLDDVSISQSQIDSGTGRVTSGSFLGKVYIWKWLGSDGQTADPVLDAAFTEWTSDHRGRGVTYVHIRLETDETLFPNGQHPRDFFFRVKGVRAYNPVLDSTNGGSGTHRYADPRTWEWTQNAALLQTFYLMGGSKVFDVNTAALKGLLGFGADAADINWTSIAAAANVSDEDVIIPPASPTTTQKRYTLNGVLSTANNLADNMEQLLTASVGQLVFSGGSYNLYAGSYEAPSISIDEDDLAGDATYTTGTPRDKRYNAVQGTFFDSQTWQDAEFVPKTSSTFQTRDGGRQLWRNVTLPFTDDGYRAQRIAQLYLNQSDNQRVLKWDGQISCFKVSAWGTVFVTCAELELDEAVHRCIGWDFDEQGVVSLELREESLAAYTDPDVADYGSIAVATAAVNPDDSLPAPSNLRATGQRNGILFEWDSPTPAPPGITYELFEYTSATPFSSATRLHRTAQTSIFVAKTDTTQRYYWVRSRINSDTSSETPTGNGIPAKASVIDTSLAASVSPTSLNTVVNVATGTSSSCTATPSGGTGPFTYAWTRTSGDTTITADAATSASTTFSCTGLTPSEVNQAIFRCTITDSLSATAFAEVSVRFERSALGVSASNVFGTASGFASSGTVTTSGHSPNVTVSNGSGTYTYSWTQTGTPATNGPYGVSSSTAQNPTWSDTVSDGAASPSESWQVTVTDTPSGATASTTITVTLTWTDLS